MNLKSEKGFTGIDITVALIIITLFVSIITVIFYNITKSSKEMERNSEATYIATDIIEKFKASNYDELKTTTNEENDNYVSIEQYNQDNKGIISDINITDGYTVSINVEQYNPEGETLDIVKIVKVKVEYKLGTEVKNVELKTTLTRN